MGRDLGISLAQGDAVLFSKDLFDFCLAVFPGLPVAPGMPCQGEDRSIYRRGARRWRKVYKVNGHIFQAKRFNRRAFCAYCHDRIWGLGRQGFKCCQCKLLIHKKCHKLIKVGCDVSQVRQLEKDFAENGKRETDSFLRPGIGAVSEILDENNEVSPIETSTGAGTSGYS